MRYGRHARNKYIQLALWVIGYVLLFVLFILFFLNNRVHGFFPFYYYTQWTLTVGYIYFWFGSMFSIYGWFRYGREELDEEQATNQSRPRRVAGFWGYVYQVIYQLNKTLHAVNAVFFLGEAALNNVRFPWFRIAYFALWTCFYVVFHWALHVLSRAIGYFLLALSHVACYGVIYLLIKLKHFLLKNLLQDG